MPGCRFFVLYGSIYLDAVNFLEAAHSNFFVSPRMDPEPVSMEQLHGSDELYPFLHLFEQYSPYYGAKYLRCCVVMSHRRIQLREAPVEGAKRVIHHNTRRYDDSRTSDDDPLVPAV